MTPQEQRTLANNYYCQAMQIIEDRESGLTEFVREDDVFELLYDMASDFYAMTLGEL